MPVDQQLLKGSTISLILAALKQHPMYGYQIIKEIETLSQGAFIFKEGTLYPILHDMEKKGWLAAQWEKSEAGRKRKFYRLTPQGEKALSRRKNQWDEFKSAVDRILSWEV